MVQPLDRMRKCAASARKSLRGREGPTRRRSPQGERAKLQFAGATHGGSGIVSSRMYPPAGAGAGAGAAGAGAAGAGAGAGASAGVGDAAPRL